MSEESLHFYNPHLLWVMFVVKPDEALDPVHVDLRGAYAVMFHTRVVAYLIEQFG